MSAISDVLLSKKTVIITTLAIVVAAGLLTAWIIGNQQQADGSSTYNNEAPTFRTVLPVGKTIEQLGGWTRISPTISDPVYTYVDKVDGIVITVSEQPLPEEFKKNLSNQVSELAKKFNATTEIDAGGTKVYVGTSAQGPQSVIFSQDNLLILIKSQKKIDNKDWTQYVQSLSLIVKY